MQKKLFAIFDNKTNEYGLPVCYTNSAEAIRAFTDILHQKDTIYAQHPQDFALVEIGTYNITDAKLTEAKSKNFLGFGNEFKYDSEINQQELFDHQAKAERQQTQ